MKYEYKIYEDVLGGPRDFYPEETSGLKAITVYRTCPSVPKIVDANLNNKTCGYLRTHKIAKEYGSIWGANSNSLYHKFGATIIKYRVLADQEAIEDLKADGILQPERVKVLKATVVDTIPPEECNKAEFDWQQENHEEY
jgi:hypothetical protein